jgi:hypothetical protein
VNAVAAPLRTHRRSAPAGLPALALLPVGPAAVAALRFLLPYATPASPHEQVAAVAAHPGRQSGVLWLGLVAVLTLVPGVVLAGRLTRSAAPRLTVTAMVLLVPGYLCLTWVFAGDVVVAAVVRAGISTADAVRVVAAMHPVLAVGTAVFVVGHVVGTVLLGIALLRTRSVPAWAGWAMTISQPLHFVAAVILLLPGLDLLAWSLTAIAMAAVAAALARASVNRR